MSIEETMTNVRSLTRPEWLAARDEYIARVRPWVDDRLIRMSRNQKHPVYDFLFEYYSFRPAHLMRWTPGISVRLESATQDDLTWSEFRQCNNGLLLLAGSFPAHRLPYLHWACDYLRRTAEREPTFTCLGLHEWAMVYRDPNVRHPYVPFRLSREETDAFVESQPLRCSHFDAFRFFSSQAVPRNRWELTRATTADHDQPGCLHVNMDLYRFAYKIAPFCPSELVADAFDLALAAREIDMRASPYDLSEFGLTPLKIETPEGRAEYVELQRELHVLIQPVRERLIGVYEGLSHG